MDKKIREAARKLSDIEIPEDYWKADFDIVDRYQNFANEIIRFALLGIAGYAYLVVDVCLGKDKLVLLLNNLRQPILCGTILLCLSLGAALAHRFYSTSCLFHQVNILRSLKRRENPHWSEDEKALELERLHELRSSQLSDSNFSHKLLIAAAVCFVCGYLFVIDVFYVFLCSLCSSK